MISQLAFLIPQPKAGPSLEKFKNLTVYKDGMESATKVAWDSLGACIHAGDSICASLIKWIMTFSHKCIGQVSIE